MAKAIDLINFIKVNKLEEVPFADGYDDNYCLSFEIDIDDDHTISYEFAHKGKQETRIRLFTLYHDDDCNMDEEVISSEKALELRGLAE